MSDGPEACSLCREQKSLQRSHIIPKFVFRWHKETGTGVLRMTTQPNRRVQDGVTLQLLCSDCESLLSRWERSFANELFLPMHNAPRGEYVQCHYGPWALKFAVSLSWRSLQYLRTVHDMTTLAPARLNDVLRAEETWRRFLLGELEHPAEFEQRFVRLGEIAALPRGFSGFSEGLNRYWMRATDVDLLEDDDGLLLVYTKIARFVILGIVSRGKLDFGGQRLAVRKGSIRKNSAISMDLIAFLNGRAEHGLAALRSLSDYERAKNAELVAKRGAAYKESDAFAAIRADMRLRARSTRSTSRRDTDRRSIRRG